MYTEHNRKQHLEKFSHILNALVSRAEVNTIARQRRTNERTDPRNVPATSKDLPQVIAKTQVKLADIVRCLEARLSVKNVTNMIYKQHDEQQQAHDAHSGDERNSKCVRASQTQRP